MPLDLVSQLTSLENLLEKNNTSTSSHDISANLKERVKYFLKGVEGFHTRATIPKTMYPVIFTELITTPEEFAEMGNSSNRNIDINFQIIPVIDYGMGSEIDPGESMENSDLELIRLAQNINALIRNNITLSGTVDDCNIENTEYSTIINEPKTYNGAATISILAKKLST